MLFLIVLYLYSLLYSIITVQVLSNFKKLIFKIITYISKEFWIYSCRFHTTSSYKPHMSLLNFCILINLDINWCTYNTWNILMIWSSNVGNTEAGSRCSPLQGDYWKQWYLNVGLNVSILRIIKSNPIHIFICNNVSEYYIHIYILYTIHNHIKGQNDPIQ